VKKAAPKGCDAMSPSTNEGLRSTAEETLPARTRYQQARSAHWDGVAELMDTWRGLGAYYHRRLAEIYQFLIMPGLRVLEIGCGWGDLLAALRPARGVGVDFSGEMVSRASSRHPELHFIQQDAHSLSLEEQFDVVILSDLLNDVWDVQTVLERLLPVTTRKTKLIINSYSLLWQVPLAVTAKLNLARPTLYQNWLTLPDMSNLLQLAGYETIRTWQEILLPFNLPVLSRLANRFLVRLWPFRHLALTNFILATSERETVEQPTVSVIVPARNEAGNIEDIFKRMPELGAGTEMVFVEGHSTDDTYQVIGKMKADHPDRDCLLFRQEGKGKGDAVRLGFAKASGDVLMILDADLTVPPEDLGRFLSALQSGRGEFINGVRLVYPMAGKAMRFANLIGNKFFSLAFSWLLGQSVKDTLCGTKVLWRDDYELIAAHRDYFGDFDPFGDFDLLFGAAKLGLKIVDLPVRYQERTYGTTNISRWRHGWLLLRMVAFAAGRIKFV
jgi:SAM-dependent methyltransferase